MPDQLRVRIGERAYEIDPDRLADLDVAAAGPDAYHVLIGGRSYRCELLGLDLPGKRVDLRVNGRRLACRVDDAVDLLVEELGLGAGDERASGDVHAPMPGLVVDVLVAEGQAVEAGERLLVLEAMKMENSLTAEGAGTVRRVAVERGAAVEKGQLLIEIEA